MKKNIKRFDIYRNLHKKGFSVRDRKTGKVITVLENILAIDCDFVVQPKGRAKVLREKKKCVHAFIRCNDYQEVLNKSKFLSHLSGSTQVYYNPYKGDKFCLRTEDGQEVPVESAKAVFLSGSGGILVS